VFPAVLAGLTLTLYEEPHEKVHGRALQVPAAASQQVAVPHELADVEQWMLRAFALFV
jgi:hypothetical protein